MNNYEIMDVHDITEITLAYKQSIADKDNENMFSLGYQWADKPHRHVYQLCGKLEAIAAERDAALASVAKLREALERIAAIEDKAFGGDWEEIEEARTIARAVLEETK